MVGELARTAGDGEKGSKRGGNWLQILAGALAEIQAKFLNDALEAADIMAGEAENATELGPADDASNKSDSDSGGSITNAAGGESGTFLKAQADYTASMQLFTIFSNQTSTSIKSVGESLAAISRKQ